MNRILLFFGGTDPSGGGGLFADVKTASAMGFHGCPVVTALTVQTSGNVISWEAVDSYLVKDQVLSVLEDGPVAGVKTGMLGTEQNLRKAAELIRNRISGVPVAVDPVLSAGGGASLTRGQYLDAMIDELLPLADLLTPNIPEAELIIGWKIDSVHDMIEAAKRIKEMGPSAVLLKGGHLQGKPRDVLVTPHSEHVFSGSRIAGGNVHGTGCSMASACTAFLASGFSVHSSVERARRFLRNVISRKIPRKHGNLPGHFPAAAPMPAKVDGTSFYLPPAYCAMCGETMDQTPGEHGHLFCSSCGYVHYRNPLPAVTLLVHDDDKVLLVERAVPPGKGRLCLPGGFMETGETPVECGERELMEETGIRAVRSRLLELETDSTAYGGVLLAVMEVTEWEGEPVAGDDASRVLWTSLEEVPPLAFDAHDRLVKKLAEILDADDPDGS